VIKKFLPLLVLLGLSLIRCSYAQTYRVVILGSIHKEGSRTVVDPGVWGTNLVDDTVNGILEFDVVEHPLGYEQMLGASEKPTEGELLNLPILKKLKTGDHVRIDYKGCKVEKSYTKAPLRDEYHIFFVGEANSVTINTVEIPEFSKVPAMVLVLTALTVGVSLLKYRQKWNIRGE